MKNPMKCKVKVRTAKGTYSYVGLFWSTACATIHAISNARELCSVTVMVMR